MSHSQFRCSILNWHMHGLIFKTSICNWQDQPGYYPQKSLTAVRFYSSGCSFILWIVFHKVGTLRVGFNELCVVLDQLWAASEDLCHSYCPTSFCLLSASSSSKNLRSRAEKNSNAYLRTRVSFDASCKSSQRFHRAIAVLACLFYV